VIMQLDYLRGTSHDDTKSTKTHERIATKRPSQGLGLSLARWSGRSSSVFVSLVSSWEIPLVRNVIR
jgi:hypothetical protein